MIFQHHTIENTSNIRFHCCVFTSNGGQISSVEASAFTECLQKMENGEQVAVPQHHLSTMR